MSFAGRRVVVLATALAAALVACGTDWEQNLPLTSSATAAPVHTGVSNGKAYTVDRSSSTGTTTDGAGRWDLAIDTLTGGDPRVSAAFNDAVHHAAQRLLDETTAARPDKGRWTFETSPQIRFATTSVSALISGEFSVEGADHSVGSVTNVVIDSRSGRQITLKELFVNDQEGLNRLSEQTKLLLPPAMGVTATPMPNHPGNKPLLENFDNWIPTPAGLEIHFADHQFTAGTPVITVPWSALNDLLAPGMDALRRP
ncbi:RsiV family protein [Mycobacterium sp. DL592]|uniref:RsiV family protein n=1 Tax=Mycobacterium sp. DL592 TaxID=2675524 RepID=UPI00142104ED|nr:RsiV family protein [Mycobacterium sp. DL592]